MFLFNSIIVFVCLASVYCENTNNCPRFCTCDSYLLLNRAQCSSKSLISAEVDVPNQVQILDLSFNDITSVDTNCFKHFSYLKYLNLSNNALHTLDLEAFSKLRRLLEIDLSYNRLEYLDERLLARNNRLRKLNLEGNKFMSLNPKALLYNPFLIELNLKNSQINMLRPELFVGLPNLLQLDLSKNLLNHFNSEDFQYLTKLQKLNLNENPLKCDETLKSKLTQLAKRGMNVTLDNCSHESLTKSNQASKMFEKIIMTPSPIIEIEDALSAVNRIEQWRLQIDLEEESVENDQNDEDLDFDFRDSHGRVRNTNEWIRFAPDAIICNVQNYVLCEEYKTCLIDLNKAWHEQRKYKEQCPVHDIKFAFFLGIAMGISGVIFILACALCMKNCLEIKKSTPPPALMDDLPSQPLARPISQLPPQVRRQTRRRATPATRAAVRYEGPIAENFLSRLFGRPARHQYYRSINQNTATLIRRLSRSNLFNNRLSQHFLDRQNSEEPSSPELQNVGPSARRPETPPPSYVDVVVNNSGERK